MPSNKCCSTKNSITKRVLFIGTIIVFSLIVFSILTSAFIFNAIFRRRAIDQYDFSMRYLASDEISHPRTNIEFPSGNNELSGYIYGESNDKGIIVIVNGLNAGVTSHLAETFYFVDEGWTVLAFDGTGVGESEGNSVVGLEQTRRDVLAALDFIADSDTLSQRPVFLYGHSAGGYAAATLCDDDRICAVVSISGFNSPLDIMRYYAKKHVGVLADINYPFMRLYDRMLFGKDGQITAKSYLSNTKKPVLIVQGSEDEVVPFEQSIYASCASENNAKINSLLVDEDYRNRHSTIWLASDAAREFLENRDYKDEMISSYGMKDLPENVQIDLAEDAEIANEILRNVNTSFLQNVSSFFYDALRKTKA